jgi:hypothetical protein
MRSLLLSLVVLAACGGSKDPHVVGACEGWTDNAGNPFNGMCEAACTKPPPVTTLTCDTVARLNCARFDFDGTDGCCVDDGDTIRFYECQ